MDVPAPVVVFVVAKTASAQFVRPAFT